jgi:hypothetical protein
MTPLMTNIVQANAWLFVFAEDCTVVRKRAMLRRRHQCREAALIKPWGSTVVRRHCQCLPLGDFVSIAAWPRCCRFM